MRHVGSVSRFDFVSPPEKTIIVSPDSSISAVPAFVWLKPDGTSRFNPVPGKAFGNAEAFAPIKTRSSAIDMLVKNFIMPFH